MLSTKKFFAYPGEPIAIGQSIEAAIKNNSDVNSWKALDIYGHFIAEKVIEGINSCNIFIADISVFDLPPKKWTQWRVWCSINT